MSRLLVRAAGSRIVPPWLSDPEGVVGPRLQEEAFAMSLICSSEWSAFPPFRSRSFRLSAGLPVAESCVTTRRRRRRKGRNGRLFGQRIAACNVWAALSRVPPPSLFSCRIPFQPLHPLWFLPQVADVGCWGREASGLVAEARFESGILHQLSWRLFLVASCLCAEASGGDIPGVIFAGGPQPLK